MQPLHVHSTWVRIPVSGSSHYCQQYDTTESISTPLWHTYPIQTTSEPFNIGSNLLNPAENRIPACPRTPGLRALCMLYELPAN